MKLLLKMFGNNLPESEASLIAPVRMQALGTLVAYLEHRFGARVTITQASVYVTKVTSDSESTAPLQCTAMLTANFFWAGREKQHGRTYEAPLPPRAAMHLTFASYGEQTLQWLPVDGALALVNIGQTEPEVNHGDFIHVSEVEEFTTQFNLHRPWGFSIMQSGHDSVIWNINPKPEDVSRLG